MATILLFGINVLQKSGFTGDSRVMTTLTHSLVLTVECCDVVIGSCLFIEKEQTTNKFKKLMPPESSKRWIPTCIVSIFYQVSNESYLKHITSIQTKLVAWTLQSSDSKFNSRDNSNSFFIAIKRS